MWIAVMGTGGVGGYFGARLAQAGHEVAFVARGRQLKALRANGLRLESPLGDIHLPNVSVTDQPAGIGQVDLVLFTVKLWDTLGAAESVKPLLGAETAVVSFQNGVVKDDILREALGDGHVIDGVTYIAATIAEPGSSATPAPCRSWCSASRTGRCRRGCASSATPARKAAPTRRSATASSRRSGRSSSSWSACPARPTWPV